jgi:hypothetical protein
MESSTDEVITKSPKLYLSAEELNKMRLENRNMFPSTSSLLWLKGAAVDIPGGSTSFESDMVPTSTRNEKE